ISTSPNRNSARLSARGEEKSNSASRLKVVVPYLLAKQSPRPWSTAGALSPKCRDSNPARLSQPVRSLWAVPNLQEYARHFLGLARPDRVSAAQFSLLKYKSTQPRRQADQPA